MLLVFGRQAFIPKQWHYPYHHCVMNRSKYNSINIMYIHAEYFKETKISSKPTSTFVLIIFQAL